jgi:transcription elongation factor Elf1
MRTFVCDRCGKQEINGTTSGYVRIRTGEDDIEYEMCSKCIASLIEQLKSDRAKVYDKILGR